MLYKDGGGSLLRIRQHPEQPLFKIQIKAGSLGTLPHEGLLRTVAIWLLFSTRDPGLLHFQQPGGQSPQENLPAGHWKRNNFRKPHTEICELFLFTWMPATSSSASLHQTAEVQELGASHEYSHSCFRDVFTICYHFALSKKFNVSLKNEIKLQIYRGSTPAYATGLQLSIIFKKIFMLGVRQGSIF